MKNKLNNEELELVSGGQILCSIGGSYYVYKAKGEIIQCGSLRSASECEWKLFGDSYGSIGIFSVDELEDFYYDIFNRQ